MCMIVSASSADRVSTALMISQASWMDASSFRVAGDDAVAPGSATSRQRWGVSRQRDGVDAPYRIGPGAGHGCWPPVHPVAMSVTVSVCTKLPFDVGPLWVTRSASMNPGAGSSQPSKVRTGTLRRIAEGAARRRVLPPAASGRSWRHSSPAHSCAPLARAADGRAAPSPRPGSAPTAAAACRKPDPRLPDHNQCFTRHIVIQAPARA